LSAAIAVVSYVAGDAPDVCERASDGEKVAATNAATIVDLVLFTENVSVWGLLQPPN